MLLVNQPDRIREFLGAELTQAREVVLGADVDKYVFEDMEMLHNLPLKGLVLNWVFYKLRVANLPKSLVMLHALSVGGCIVYLPVLENAVHYVGLVCNQVFIVCKLR